MLVDRAFRFAFRNYSTLWLIAATVFFPLHLAHGYVFRDVIAVSDIHDAIEGFPVCRPAAGREDCPQRQVKEVSRLDLAAARTWYAAVTAVEIALIPALAGAAIRVLQEDVRGHVPGALRSWAGAVRPHLRAQFARPGPLVAALVISVAIGWLAEASGRLLVEPVPEGLLWVGGAVVAATARSIAAPFLLATLALCAVEHEPRVQGIDRVGK